jgi:hypothetical protein
VLAFHHCCKMLGRINLKGGKVFSAHRSRGFIPWSHDPSTLGLCYHSALWWKRVAEETCSPHSSGTQKEGSQAGWHVSGPATWEVEVGGWLKPGVQGQPRQHRETAQLKTSKESLVWWFTPGNSTHLKSYCLRPTRYKCKQDPI